MAWEVIMPEMLSMIVPISGYCSKGDNRERIRLRWPV